jgi:hypothetical protein
VLFSLVESVSFDRVENLLAMHRNACVRANADSNSIPSDVDDHYLNVIADADRLANLPR